MLRPSGVITLLTDFGGKDPFVGVMKGVILSRFGGARIVDLTHGIEPQGVAEAAFWLSKSYVYFPRGTVHVAVVDPGVGTDRAALAAVVGGQYFLAPDNGLLDPLLNSTMEAEVRTVSREYLLSLHIESISRTFHGRDVFAPVAAEIASGGSVISSVGPIAGQLAPPILEQPRIEETCVEGSVVTVDRFGNLVTNIDDVAMTRFKAPAVEMGDLVIPVLGTYHDAVPGDYLALINAFGVLEIARSEGSAARGLGVSRGAQVIVRERHAL